MPTEQFRQSVALNLTYWLNLTRGLDNAAFRALSLEHANIIRAVQFGLQLEETFNSSATLFVQAYPLIEGRGDWQKWIPLMEGAYERRYSLSPALQLKYLDCLGQCYRQERQFEKAIELFSQLEYESTEQEDTFSVALAHLRLSQVYWAVRNYALCEKHSKAALSVFMETADVDPLSIASAYTIHGLLRYGQGNHEKAVVHLNKAISIYRQMDKAELLGRSLMNLALSLEASGEKQAALDLYQEAQLVLQETDFEIDKIRVELSLGTLLLNWGRLDEAEAAFHRANSPYLRRSGLLYYQALTANNLGNTFFEMGRLSEAERYLEGSVLLWKRCGGRLMLANSLGTLAEVALAKGQFTRGEKLYGEAIEITAEYLDDAWGRRLNKKFLSAVESLQAKRKQEMGTVK